jgi:predicted chitinase
LVEKPEIAAKVAVWFWQNRVAPRVANFNDTQQATKPINPGMRGLADRHTKFNAIKQGAMTTPQQLAPRGRRT